MRIVQSLLWKYGESNPPLFKPSDFLENTKDRRIIATIFVIL